MRTSGKSFMQTLRVGALLAVVILLVSCGEDKTAGTMIGTENVVQAGMVVAGGEPAVSARVMFRPLDSLPSAISGNVADSVVVVTETDGSFFQELDTNSDWSMEVTYTSQDSQWAYWKPLIEKEQIREGLNLEKIELQPATASFVGKVTWNNPQIQKVWLGFGFLNQLQLLHKGDSFLFEGIPTGAFQVDIYLRNFEGRVFSSFRTDEIDFEAGVIKEGDIFVDVSGGAAGMDTVTDSYSSSSRASSSSESSSSQSSFSSSSEFYGD